MSNVSLSCLLMANSCGSHILHRFPGYTHVTCQDKNVTRRKNHTITQHSSQESAPVDKNRRSRMWDMSDVNKYGFHVRRILNPNFPLFSYRPRRERQDMHAKLELYHCAFLLYNDYFSNSFVDVESAPTIVPTQMDKIGMWHHTERL